MIDLIGSHYLTLHEVVMNYTHVMDPTAKIAHTIMYTTQTSVPEPDLRGWNEDYTRQLRQTIPSNIRALECFVADA
jgi:hypothetical protein